MIKTFWLNKEAFERALHGNRGIDFGTMNIDVGETIQLFCKDIYYSYPIEVTIRSKFYKRGTMKTTKGVRTSRFPFL